MTKFTNSIFVDQFLVSSDSFIDRKLILGGKTMCQSMRQCPFAVSLKKRLGTDNWDKCGDRYFHIWTSLFLENCL